MLPPAAAAGVDLSGYNTIENARDVKALRRALGFEKWNVWGISYGSILGQAYIKEDPDGILLELVEASALVPANRSAELYDEYLRRAGNMNYRIVVFPGTGIGGGAMVPVALGEQTRDALAAAGYPLEWHTYDMPHAVCPEEITDIRQWIVETLGADE